ncbi:MAG: class I SAM-dependent methyltransferase [Saprospiraceae bacterium]
MKILRTALILSSLCWMALSCQNDRNHNDVEEQGTQLPVTDTATPTNGKRNPGITEDYENTDRVIWQKPDLVIDLLGDLTGKTVADIGAGTGFFALRLAPQAKKVIAIDIDQRFVNYLDSVKVLELPENLQSHLESRLARPDDPNLKAGEADVVLIVNTFMYIRNRVEYLAILKKGMSNGGKLIIVDFKKKRTPIGPPSDIRLPIHEVEEALYTAGFKNIETNDTALDYQYFVMAEK